MPSPQLGGIGPGSSYEDLLNYVIRLERKLDYVLQTLDSENIFEAGGWRVNPDQLASKDNDVGMSTEDTGGDDIRFWAGDVKTGAPKFKVTKSGILSAVDGVFEGEITAESGTIGGWVISEDQLATTDNEVGMSTENTGGDDIRFWAGDAKTGSPNFKVTKAGILTAVDGEFSGTITADEGEIGGWVISADALKDAAGTVGMSTAVTGGDDIRFWAGNATPASAPYRVTEAGALTASSGEIGGFTITSTALTAISGGTIQNHSSAADNVRFDDTGFHANDSSGVERLTIGTTPSEGAKALIGRDSTGAVQSAYTYDSETVDGSSRTGQFITAHGAVILISDDGDIRIMNSSGGGVRIVSGYPEVNDGFGWETVAIQSEVDLKATAGDSTSTDGSHNHGIPNGTVLMVDGGGTVTFVTSGSHSHTQT